MNDKMISEYRAWLEKHVRTCDQGESDGRAMLKMCLREFNEAAARHEATEPLAVDMPTVCHACDNSNGKDDAWCDHYAADESEQFCLLKARLTAAARKFLEGLKGDMK